jgi:hypothetical protein
MAGRKALPKALARYTKTTAQMARMGKGGSKVKKATVAKKATAGKRKSK